MININDIWLWGQDAGSHHAVQDNIWNLPGENKMTSEEGLRYFGIKNVCRVTMSGSPEPPFDAETEKLAEAEKIVWSFIGDGGTKRANEGITDIDAVIDVSKKYKNVIGGISDDFFGEERMRIYTPAAIKEMADKLHRNNLEMWTVIYEIDMDKDVAGHLNHCDVTTFWTWKAENIEKIEENIVRLKKMVPASGKIYCGCYLWDYGNSAPMPMTLMKKQLEIYDKLYTEGVINGVILCSNCIADIGLDTAEYMKEWIKENTY